MHEGCTKLTTLNTTIQTLKLTHTHSESNLTLEMNPFLIRSENGNIAITLSEINDNLSRCYQICEYFLVIKTFIKISYLRNCYLSQM